MKFATLAALVAVAYAQDEEGEEAACDKADPEACPPLDDVAQSCGTMTMDGFSVDQCIDDILCGEVLELEGIEQSYTCGTGEEEAKATYMAASAAALLAITYAM